MSHVETEEDGLFKQRFAINKMKIQKFNMSKRNIGTKFNVRMKLQPFTDQKPKHVNESEPHVETDQDILEGTISHESAKYSDDTVCV